MIRDSNGHDGLALYQPLSALNVLYQSMWNCTAFTFSRVTDCWNVNVTRWFLWYMLRFIYGQTAGIMSVYKHRTRSLNIPNGSYEEHTPVI